MAESATIQPLPPTPTAVEEHSSLWDLCPHHDANRVLRNPHKGWYWHLYGHEGSRNAPWPESRTLAEEAELVAFPGLDHAYYRAPWSWFEPSEGRYDWSSIDDLIARLRPKGQGFALRFMTCEPNHLFDTPEWVKDAGAQGGFYSLPEGGVAPGYGYSPGDTCWMPEWDDPIYLQKLEQFIAAAAARYDGHPGLRYVDIALGMWGEGHEWPRNHPITLVSVQSHIDIYRRHFKRTQLVLPDEAFDVARPVWERDFLRTYTREHHVTVRDDSLFHGPMHVYCAWNGSLMRTNLFEDHWAGRPIILETAGYWENERMPILGSPVYGYYGGARMIFDALRLAHATYISPFFSPREFLRDHPLLANEVANFAGYWFFPHSFRISTPLEPGAAATVHLKMENRGAAPAYQPYSLRLHFIMDGEIRVVELCRGVRDWQPGRPVQIEYPFILPHDLPPGRYRFSIGLFDTSQEPNRPLEFGLHSHRQLPDGSWLLGEIEIAAAR